VFYHKTPSTVCHTIATGGCPCGGGEKPPRARSLPENPEATPTVNSVFTNGKLPSKSLHHALWIYDMDSFYLQLLSCSFSGIHIPVQLH
jgi:hypothetical protein